MITESKINNVGEIKPIINATWNDPSKVKFGSVFPNPYNTTFLCAKRKSGKTSVLAEILDKTSNKNTVFWIFCPTTNIDDSWKAILKKLEDKGNVVNVFDSIMENKLNQLNEIIDSLAKGSENDDSTKTVKPIKKLICDGCIENNPNDKPKRKPKKISPEHIFVFDDLSHELKNPAIYKLLKNGRHLKSAVYISFQFIHDVLPAGLKQAEHFILFKSFSEDKLQHIYKQLDLSLDFEKFKELYQYVMKDNGYDFLFINVKEQEFRKNFNRFLNLKN